MPYLAGGWSTNSALPPSGKFGEALKSLLSCSSLALLLGRRAAFLAPGEPVALLKTFPGCPNGTKDHIFEEFLLEGKMPLCLYYKVDRDVGLQRGHQKIL